MAFVVADAELPLDDLGDAGAGPDLAAEAVRLRPMPQELGDRTLLPGREPRRVPRRGSRPEHLRAKVPGVGQPAAHGDLGDVEGLGDIALIPALSLEAQRAEPPPFTTLRRDGMARFHPSILLLQV